MACNTCIPFHHVAGSVVLKALPHHVVDLFCDVCWPVMFEVSKH